MTQPVAQWTHNPNHPTAADHEFTTPDRCIDCWCYGCGAPTDGPRDRRGDDRTDLPDPDDHRWCYE